MSPYSDGFALPRGGPHRNLLLDYPPTSQVRRAECRARYFLARKPGDEFLICEVATIDFFCEGRKRPAWFHSTSNLHQTVVAHQSIGATIASADGAIPESDRTVEGPKLKICTRIESCV